jgi:hypothetical protein
MIGEMNDVTALDGCRRASTPHGHALLQHAFHGVLLAATARFGHPGDEGFSSLDNRRVFDEAGVRVLVIPRKLDDLKSQFCKDLAVLRMLSPG